MRLIFFSFFKKGSIFLRLFCTGLFPSLLFSFSSSLFSLCKSGRFGERSAVEQISRRKCEGGFLEPESPSRRIGCRPRNPESSFTQSKGRAHPELISGLDPSLGNAMAYIHL